MVGLKSCLLVGGLALLGAAACSEPSGIEDRPEPVAKKDAGRPRKKDAGVVTDVASSTGSSDDDSTGRGSEDDGEDDDATGGQSDSDSDSDDEGAGDDDVPVKADAGRANDGGPTKGAGSTKDAGGGSSDAPLEPCPATYTCSDPASSLAKFSAEGTVTDADGKSLAFACSTGGQEMCDPEDPKKSCPKLPNAFCAHVVLSSPVAIDLYNCAQLCTP